MEHIFFPVFEDRLIFFDGVTLSIANVEYKEI